MYADLSAVMRGDSWWFDVTVADEDGVPVGIAGDLITFTMKLQKELGDVDAAVLEAETVPSGAEADAGRHRLKVDAANTEGVVPGVYFYDMQWKDVSETPARVTTLQYGTIEVLGDVTIATS